MPIGIVASRDMVWVVGVVEGIVGALFAGMIVDEVCGISGLKSVKARQHRMCVRWPYG